NRGGEGCGVATKKKQRNLVKGGSVATGSETAVANKGKEVTTTIAVVPVAEGQDTAGAEREGWKTRGREKTGDAKSGRAVL
ncbi:hypothetical protein Dimus_022073, partial [Dionaea muscipula]